MAYCRLDLFLTCDLYQLKEVHTSHWEISVSLVVLRNAMLQHLIIQLLLYYLSSGPLREVKNKRKFQTFSSKSGCAHLQEVLNIVIWLGNFWYFGKLVAYKSWSQPEVRLYFWFHIFLNCEKSVLQIFMLLYMNVNSEQISYSWNFEVGSYTWILRKKSSDLLVPSLSLGTWSLILAICRHLDCSSFI